METAPVTSNQYPSEQKPRGEKIASPLLKWAGGKNWFAKATGASLRNYLVAVGGRYIEPFLGSGAVALWLLSQIELQRQPDRFILTDVLEPLCEFHSVVRDYPGELAWGLSALAIQGVDEENYYRVRDLRPDGPVARAARLFYLNRIGFNGLYRENKKGDFNVPYGDACYRKSVVGRSARDAIESLFPNREKIQLVSDALKGALIGQADFGEPIDEAQKGDLIYADSPYDGTFESYSSGGFGDGDQERLAEALYRAHERGTVFVAHNALTDRVKYFYSEWCQLIEVAEKRSIAANGSRRQRAPAVVITNDEVMANELRRVLG